MSVPDFRAAQYDDIDWSPVDRVTICCFLNDGQLIMVDGPGGYRMPAGSVDSGEDVVLDAALRIPLQVAGFRRQGTHVVAQSEDQEHVLLWVDGARYFGDRPHADPPWWTGPADRAAELLRAQGDDGAATAVELADHHRTTITDQQIAADSRRILDPSYLDAETAEGGSGFGGTPQEWRAAREHLCDAIPSDGTFLDIGCANGLLMESVVAWSGMRGITVEPYGVDHSPALVDLARRRLPQWADRIWVGDVLTWRHPTGMRFDVVAVMTDIILPKQHREMIMQLLDHVVAPDGRLLLSNYGGGTYDSGANVLRRNGFPVDGETSRPQRGRPDDQRSAWVINSGRT